MSTNYPGSLDTFPADIDNLTLAVSADQNNRAAALVALQKFGFPVYNVRTYGGAKGDGATDDTAAINTLESFVSSNGGGTIYFPPGTYIASGIVKQSNVDWLGSGTAASAIKLKNSATTTTPLVIGANFASLTGTGGSGGITNFHVSRLLFDGNSSNNASYTASLIQWYAFGYEMDSFVIVNPKGPALWSEWGTSGAVISPIGLEAKIRNFQILFGGSHGIEWLGPHDSLIGPGIIANMAGHSVWTQSNGGACVFERVHCWGATQDWSWYLDTNAYLFECQGEDGSAGAVWCRGDGVQIVGGQWFSTPIAFQLGITAGHASARTHIRSAAVLGITSAAVSFLNDGGGNLIEFYTTGSNTTVTSGTQSANTLIVVANTGAGGAPNSPFTFWSNGAPGWAIRDTNPPTGYFRHAGNSDVAIRNNAGVFEVRNNTPATVATISQAGVLGLLSAISPGTPAGATQTGQIFQGSGAPSNSNGNNGDAYFRTDTPGTANQRLYVKSAGAWVGVL